MTDDRLRLLLELFEECVDLGEDERQERLDRLRQEDEELHTELSRMLQADDRAHKGLHGIVEASAASSVGVLRLPKPGESVGAYQLIEVIGRGGMGVVFRARQTKLDREVALKVIRPGIDTTEVLRRFELERRVLGRLDHPGVSRIYDSGATSAGLPFFVMEFLPSEPLGTFCDGRALTTRDRLALFLGVCDVVEHAHARGVLHRDLKPSNILVTERDGRPVPVLIDFGVARVLDPAGHDPRFTRAGRSPGTPDYMSPEQREGRLDDVDTRSDVYSLGVVLFELLVGALPNEASRPSTVLSTLADTGHHIAQRQSTSVGALLRELRGDLDWIVVRALERDPVLRYSSVAELATDLRRHLSDLPITTHRSHWIHRLQKLHRRHRALTTAAAACLFLLFGGLAGTMWFGTQARAAEVQALTRLAEVERLSDRLELRDALGVVDELTPAYPARIPELTAWVESARALAGRLPLHEARLDSLRALAIPLPEPEVGGDSVRTRLAAWRVTLNLAVEADDWASNAPREEWAALVARRDSVDQALAALPPLPPAMTFPDAESQWLHDETASLVEGLTAFANPDPQVGTLAWVERRLAEAHNLSRLAETAEFAGAWHTVREEVRASTRYGGLDLPVQPDLVPLGLDPATGLQEFWHVLSGVRPRAASEGSPSRWVIGDSTGVVLVLIPPGRIRDPGEGRTRAENPQSSGFVAIPAFFASKYELTRGQWWLATGEDRSARRTAADVVQATDRRRPVGQVSIEDAQRVLPALGLRLPIEVEWLHAARAGASGSFPWSPSEPFSRYANFADVSLAQVTQGYGLPYVTDVNDGYGESAPVGSYRSNRFGLHDVLGNVVETSLPGDATRAGRLPLRGTMARLTPEGVTIEPRSHGGSSVSLPTGFDDLTFTGWNTRQQYFGIRPVRSIEVLP